MLSVRHLDNWGKINEHNEVLQPALKRAAADRQPSGCHKIVEIRRIKRERVFRRHDEGAEYWPTSNTNHYRQLWWTSLQPNVDDLRHQTF